MTSKTRVVITEQPSAGDTTYCEVRLLQGDRAEIIYRHEMWFVCDKEKQITQYFPWMKREQRLMRQFIEQGYKF